MRKIDTGVMVMKNELAWDETYADGHSTCYRWINPADSRAKIYDPRYCKNSTDVTYIGSHYFDELSTAKLVLVRRTTTVEVI